MDYNKGEKYKALILPEELETFDEMVGEVLRI